MPTKSDPAQPRARPGVTDRWRFCGLVGIAAGSAWLSCLLWVLVAYLSVQDALWRSLSWTQSITTLLPKTSMPLSWPWIYPLSIWSADVDAWNSQGVQIRASADPVRVIEVIRSAAETATWGITVAPAESDSYFGYPLWAMIAVYHIAIILLVRRLFDTYGVVRRSDIPRGHVFWAKRVDALASVCAGVAAIPLFALWRLERGVWEASFMTGGPGAWQSVEMFRGALLAMLIQIGILHWLIVCFAYRRSLQSADGLRFNHRELSLGRCPSCGYESAADVCPECGADRNDAKSIRPRIVIPWIEKRAWMRWVFRTRTALAAVVLLFFAPAWAPLVRMGISAIWP